MITVVDKPWVQEYHSGHKSESCFRCLHCPRVCLSLEGERGIISHVATEHGIRIIKDPAVISFLTSNER